ncbi:MAG TPA: metalloregulator ArsR/SmtB family transcription factor [bacterium]|jgi:DNA-binding transcriptional ArsR family regulator
MALQPIGTKSRPDDTCDVWHIDVRNVRPLLREVRDEARFDAVTRIFQLLSDPTRVKLLFALARHELCVCDLAAIVARSRTAVSHQLRFLRDLKLVKYRRSGRMAYYALADRHVRRLVLDGLRHAEED